MSTNSYMDGRLPEDIFQRIANASSTTDYDAMDNEQIDWSMGPMQKREFEQIATQLNYIEEQNSLGGFESMKVMESLIETFLQILLILVMFNQLPYEGFMNESI